MEQTENCVMEEDNTGISQNIASLIMTTPPSGVMIPNLSDKLDKLSKKIEKGSPDHVTTSIDSPIFLEFISNITAVDPSKESTTKLDICLTCWQHQTTYLLKMHQHLGHHCIKANAIKSGSDFLDLAKLYSKVSGSSVTLFAPYQKTCSSRTPNKKMVKPPSMMMTKKSKESVTPMKVPVKKGEAEIKKIQFNDQLIQMIQQLCSNLNELKESMGQRISNAVEGSIQPEAKKELQKDMVITEADKENVPIKNIYLR
ncbi:unnamed protein product [Moneuplotes crassus]|uniref:Uncharacterized protein n=1 Tax=Euplotes crassus TaxID=5936 RepID=A0AAD2D446_EUPCR|nr:unnamed protein product [Moneuplotes crassus]